MNQGKGNLRSQIFLLCSTITKISRGKGSKWRRGWEAQWKSSSSLALNEKDGGKCFKKCNITGLALTRNFYIYHSGANISCADVDSQEQGSHMCKWDTDISRTSALWPTSMFIMHRGMSLEGMYPAAGSVRAVRQKLSDLWLLTSKATASQDFIGARGKPQLRGTLTQEHTHPFMASPHYLYCSPPFVPAFTFFQRVS